MRLLGFFSTQKEFGKKGKREKKRRPKVKRRPRSGRRFGRGAPPEDTSPNGQNKNETTSLEMDQPKKFRGLTCPSQNLIKWYFPFSLKKVSSCWRQVKLLIFRNHLNFQTSPQRNAPVLGPKARGDPNENTDRKSDENAKEVFKI